MSNGHVSTDTTGMTQAQNAMQEVYGELNWAVQALQDQQDTLAANWGGETQTVFGQALENFIGDFDTINKALIGMMDALSKTTHVYVNTNDTNNQLANDFSKDLGSMKNIVPSLPGF